MPHAKRAVRLAFAIALLAASASIALAQNQAHDVLVRVPDIIGLRIVGAGTGPRSVTFDYGADPAGYFAAVDGDGSLAPTAVSRFDDVEVNATRNGRWRISVQATPFAYVGPSSPTGLALTDVRVVRSGPQDAIVGPGNSAFFAPTWTLSTSATEIASRTGATGGWRSIGVSGRDYRVAVDGDEAPGTYRTVVTYSLTAP
jgi:hypothetical protein